MAQMQKLVTSCQEDKCEKLGEYGVNDDLGARRGAWCEDHVKKHWAEVENENRRALAAQRDCAPDLVPEVHVAVKKAEKPPKRKFLRASE